MVRRELGDIAEFSEIVIDVGGGEAGDFVRIDSREVFENSNPLEVDVGSGKGRFMVARALGHPGVNFLGIERQPGRVYSTAKKAFRHGLCNVRLARVEAFSGISEMLADESVSTFYIFFPDPWPKRRHHRRRLINTEFLGVLHGKLCTGGVIHFASDHMEYAGVVEKLFAEDDRFEVVEPFVPTPDECTDFEVIFAGQNKPITRVSIKKR
jgi:tRNA (guanine-N7-)-methyltransferase